MAYDNPRNINIHELYLHPRISGLILVASLWVLGAQTATAQLDRVYDREGDNVSGTVVQTSNQGVQLKKGASTQEFKAGEILKIMYEGDPAPLTRAREFALDGQYDQALGELKNVNFAAISRDVIEADAAFYIVLLRDQAGVGREREKG